ncbi:MAG: hypothetical protein ACTHJM_05520 [Marmoricola sp.]
MPTCPNGHDVAESVAFCHECGAQVVKPAPRAPLSPDVLRYVSIAALVVIVLGTFAIAWLLNDDHTARQAAASEATVSVCGLTPKQRPTTIALGCGNSGATLTDVTWTEWTDRSATGTGTYAASGQRSEATVVLSAPTKTPTGAQFTLMTVTPNGGQSFKQSLAVFGSAPSVSNLSARVPAGGRLCAAVAHGATTRLGVIGKHTSCDFADQVRKAYVAAGGHGQDLSVTATSTITHQTYRDIACSGGRYVVCVGGSDGTARVFFGPFN